MKAYKLTDSKHRTYGGTQWGENITHKTSGKGDLCSPGWLHYYNSAELAILLNPIHANFIDPVLWEAQVNGTFLHDCGIKSGCTQLTTLRILKVPVITSEQRIKFAIYCTLEVNQDKAFIAWANAWLDGSNRSKEAAAAAAARAQRWEWAAEAAAREAAAAAAMEAAAREWAGAARAQRWEWEWEWAARAAARAAEWAARAAEVAAKAKSLDLQAIARKALAS